MICGMINIKHTEYDLWRQDQTESCLIPTQHQSYLEDDFVLELLRGRKGCSIFDDGFHKQVSYSDKKTQQTEQENLTVLALGCVNWVGLGCDMV